MGGWAARRTAEAVLLTLLGSATLVLLVQLIPGEPLAAIIGDRALDPATEAALRERWGVGRPPLTVLLDFFANALRGDLGVSLSEQRPVTEVLLGRLGPTLLLGGATLLINFTIGTWLGLWSALRRDTIRAKLLTGITLVCYAIPGFVIGLLLVWLLAITWPVFPAAGYSDPLLPSDASQWTRIGDVFRHLALPLATMVLATIAVPIRMQRSAALETRDATWVRAAIARGVTPSRVAWRHIWRPALGPVVTLLGLWLPMLVSGAIFVESVFAWPGLGSLIASAAASRDIPLVIGAGVLLVAVVQLGSLLADIVNRLLDPAQRSR
jgi:peptide/nickel transport system permease protein